MATTSREAVDNTPRSTAALSMEEDSISTEIRVNMDIYTNATIYY